MGLDVCGHQIVSVLMFMLFVLRAWKSRPFSSIIERRINKGGSIPAFCKRPVRCVVEVVVQSLGRRSTVAVDSICGSVTDSGSLKLTNHSLSHVLTWATSDFSLSCKIYSIFYSEQMYCAHSFQSRTRSAVGLRSTAFHTFAVRNISLGT